MGKTGETWKCRTKVNAKRAISRTYSIDTRTSYAQAPRHSAVIQCVARRQRVVEARSTHRRGARRSRLLIIYVIKQVSRLACLLCYLHTPPSPIPRPRRTAGRARRAHGAGGPNLRRQCRRDESRTSDQFRDRPKRRACSEKSTPSPQTRPKRKRLRDSFHRAASRQRSARAAHGG